MARKTDIDFNSLRLIPAKDLLELSYSELNGLIKQARDARANASRAIEWLTAIKFEKAIREQVETDENGGTP